MTTAVVEPSRLRPWFGLFTVLSLVLLVAMDGSVLYLAMPRITSALTPSADQSLWILDIYGFVVGSLLVTFGNIGDRYGRLLLIRVGASIFGLGSLGAAFSSTPEVLIASRALMGLGGATLLPSGLAIISAMFPDARERAQAISIFAATFAAGFAIGPVLGGMLLQSFDWGVVFLINVPVVLAFLLAAPVFLRDARSTNHGRIDVPSLLLSFVGILLFTWSVKTAAAYGLGGSQLGVGGVGLTALVLFVMRQTRLEHPLLDLGLFRDPVFSIAILTGLLSLVVWSATGYLMGSYLQSVLDRPVFTAAMLTLPGAVVLTAACVWTSRLVERIGRKAALVATHFLIGGGVLLLLFTGLDAGATVFIASSVVAGLGYGLSFSLVAEIAVSAVPVERAGAAGAIAETSNELGNALGISLLGSVAAICFRLYGPGVAGTLNETLAHASLTPELALQARQAFLTGLHVAAGIGGTMMLLLGILSWRWLPRRLPE
ncbi:EmrB/QacA family drug resistance transporter [Myxococcus stipitatus DSM 14675]|uniref:EmrB/QacA family drug resistance transporter n=1 Tax=Myxococcus stipitatus (strain DSM 14675 / JCM 12634 / Mx s8) TaxID=1278073 RepID=L7U7F6_MYXSD|nr:MFS transporter [Myxococcus stipitatus]AGC43492.1 EmrB/QacA family drug resistance transporter [Myxococcus stipitatus DSM 14675]